MKSIILIGYMCVGKTTIGKNLAKDLGLCFYDLDWYIEERYRKRISQIFEESGEEYFREIERRMLHEVAEFEDIVLACGGGTPCFFDNMEYMNEIGTTVYLKAEPEVILRHLSMARGNRPLLKDKTSEELRNYICQQIEEREVFYQKAQYIYDIDVLNEKEKIQNITDHLKLILHTRTEDEKMAD